MKFEEAIVAMRQGCAVVMGGWLEENAIMLNDGKLVMVRPKWDGGFWVVGEAGATNKWILNETWEVVWMPGVVGLKQVPSPFWERKSLVTKLIDRMSPLVGAMSTDVAITVLRMGHECYYGTEQKIPAIKKIREASGWQLREAKDALEFAIRLTKEEILKP